MWKAFVAGTAALAIAGTTLVYAQQHGRFDRGERWQPNAEDLRAFGEARSVGAELAAVIFGCGEEPSPLLPPVVVDRSDVGDADVEERAGAMRIGWSLEDDVGLVIGGPATLVQDQPGVRDPDGHLIEVGQSTGMLDEM